MRTLGETLHTYWIRLQGELLPWLDDALGPLGEHHQQLVSVLGLARIEALVPSLGGLVGRPPSERAALARAFVAKSIFNLASTAMLIERLAADKTLRRLCGWQHPGELPSASTFSRAFAAFAKNELPSRLHERLIEHSHADRLVGHISRASTAIEAREAPRPVAKAPPAAKYRRGRPRKGEVRAPPPVRRIERQVTMSLTAMLADLPRHCDIGSKRNANGHQESWVGYKLHIDTADGGIPISCILTSASVHDSQVAIPLATMTAARVVNLYDLMDSAYDVAEIKRHSRQLGHVPLIDVNPRVTPGLKQELADEAKRQRCVGHRPAEAVRYRERSTAERVNSALKDSHGGRTLRVRGPAKVMCHLMFGVLSLTALQMIRLII